MNLQPTTQRLRLRLYNARLDFQTEQTRTLMSGPWNPEPRALLSSGFSDSQVSQIMEADKTRRIDEMLAQQDWRLKRSADRQRSVSGSQIARSPLKRIARDI